MPRIYDCVILTHWGELGQLEKRFRAYQDNPDVIHVICEAGDVFRNSALSQWFHGKWNHVKVEEHEITGDRLACLREFLLHGFHGEPDDQIMLNDMKVIPEVPGGVPRGSIGKMADLT